MLGHLIRVSGALIRRKLHTQLIQDRLQARAFGRLNDPGCDLVVFDGDFCLFDPGRKVSIRGWYHA